MLNGYKNIYGIRAPQFPSLDRLDRMSLTHNFGIIISFGQKRSKIADKSGQSETEFRAAKC